MAPRLESDDSSSVHSIDDVWLRPLDVRAKSTRFARIWSAGVVLISLITVAFGIGVIVWYPWNPQAYGIYWYMVGTLTCEVLCILITAVGMVVIVLLLGRDGLQHSLTFVSICNEIFFGVSYIVCSIWGGLVIWRLLVRNEFSPSNIFLDAQGHVVWSKVPLLAYLGFTFVIATFYTLSAIPVVFGAINFALHQVQRKFQRTPIVQFYRQYNRGDEFYLRVMPVDEYAIHVTEMQNPLSRDSAVINVHAGPRTTSTEQDTLLQK